MGGEGGEGRGREGRGEIDEVGERREEVGGNLWHFTGISRG